MTISATGNFTAESSLAANFLPVISAAETALRTVSAERAEESWRPGGWSRKQILGHLCDSAVNNHLRIVRAILDGHYEGPEYDQERWVNLHGYAELSWAEIFDLWRTENRAISRVLAHAPASASQATVKIGAAQMSLSAWIEDYLAHLKHHLGQIVKSS
jgi:DinB superfamily